jgi:hypothetical protein
MSAVFNLPGAADRTAVIGATGTGKTVLGAWLLSKQRFDKRPWVAIDFKNEELWEMVGSPPIRNLKVGQMPGKRGLYRMNVVPGQDDALEEWLWKVWKHENIGLFVDEVSLMPQKDAFKAILRQGRSKRIPVIACSQRPVDVDREVWSEANYISVMRLDDIRDYKIIKGFTRDAPIDKPLPEYWSHWYDKKNFTCLELRPVPKPAIIAETLRDIAPRQFSFL